MNHYANQKNPNNPAYKAAHDNHANYRMAIIDANRSAYDAAHDNHANYRMAIIDANRSAYEEPFETQSPTPLELGMVTFEVGIKAVGTLVKLAAALL